MKSIAVVGIVVLAAVGVAAQASGPAVGYKLQPVPQAQVRVTGGFWQAKMETNRTVTIPHILAQNEQTGRVDNFRKGAGQMPGDYLGRRFNDTDIYKIVEAASYSLLSHPDPALAKQIDDLIALIAKSQQPDGYLFPARTINPAKPAAGVGTERWQYENTGSHELYNAGHLYEAAVAHFQATGSRALLDVAIKNANLVVKTFGPSARRDAPGHEVIEMALVRLFGVTQNQNYLNEAKFFVDERGTDHHASQDYTEQSWLLYNDRAYRQDDKPVVQQTRAQGHAVRAVYLYSAIADVAAFFHAADYLHAAETIWNDMYGKRAYVTGGIGTTGGTESFGADYVLPNRTAYTETCASVGAILWNHRMFLTTGEAKYLDAFEQTLYNGLLSGVSVKGDTFFYQNKLESTGREERSAYFDVACCPANLARLVAQMPGLIYATDGSTLYVALYAASEADVTMHGAKVHIKQITDYPWSGDVRLEITADRAVDFGLKVRVPGWASTSLLGTDLYTIQGEIQASRVVVGTESVRTGLAGWFNARSVSVSPVQASNHDAAVVTVTLPMPIRFVKAHPNVAEDAGKRALQRGPVLYAFEGADNGGKVGDLRLWNTNSATTTYRSDLLGGVTVITMDGTHGQEGSLQPFTAVPYFAWANRGRGEMIVWVH